MANRISRRNFLKIGSMGALSGILAGCQMPRRWVVLEPYVRPPEEQLAGVATWYASTCRMCPAGCGIIVRVMNGRALKIEGNPEHPLNRGKLCARGQAGVQLLYHPDRLSSPVTLARRGVRLRHRGDSEDRWIARTTRNISSSSRITGGSSAAGGFCSFSCASFFLAPAISRSWMRDVEPESISLISRNSDASPASTTPKRRFAFAAKEETARSWLRTYARCP